MRPLLATGAMLDRFLAPQPNPGTDPTVRVFAAPGMTIRYRHSGTAPLVAMAADPPNVVEHYDETIARLDERGMSSLVIELPGFGMSRGDPTDFAKAADGVAALLEHIAAGPAIIAFGCVSAYVGNLLASCHPRLVGAVVVLQAPSWEEEQRWIRRVDSRRLIARPVLGQAMVRVRRRRVAAEWYRAAAAQPDTAGWLTDIASDAFDHGAAFPLATIFQAGLHRPPPGIQRLDLPSTVIWGLADRSHRQTDRSTSRQLAGPQAEFVEWADSGHFPELEQPERFAALVAGFTTR